MQKIKSFITSDSGKDILIIIIVIFVGLFSFELGRLSKSSGQENIKIENNGEEAIALKSIEFSAEKSPIGNKNFFASKNGKKYYPTDCNAGKSIKASNRIYFSTREEAESAGFELSTSC